MMTTQLHYQQSAAKTRVRVRVNAHNLTKHQPATGNLFLHFKFLLLIRLRSSGVKLWVVL